MERTITIDPVNFDELKGRLDKLGRKAIKLGISVPVITEQKEWIKKVYKGLRNGKPYYEFYPQLDVTIIADEIKYGSYTHVATLDHSVGDKPIINVVPGYNVPDKYQSAGCNCDHCGINRYRKNTYVFKDTDGYKQVGSSCLQEFFGIDPTAKLNWYGSFYNIESEFSSGGGIPYIGVLEALTIGMAIVENKGFYVSKRVAIEKDMEATSDLVKEILYPNSYRLDNESGYKEWIRNINLRADELESEVFDLIIWGKDHFAGLDGEYSHNMRIVLDAEAIPMKYLGYLVSVIGAKSRETVSNKEAKRFDNEFIGAVGDKVLVDVLVHKIIPVAGNYGYSYINIMSQKESGNNIVWISSNDILSEGSEITLTGRIKALNVRDGKNQTVLTRCKIV